MRDNQSPIEIMVNTLLDRLRDAVGESAEARYDLRRVQRDNRRLEIERDRLQVEVTQLQSALANARALLNGGPEETVA